MRRVNRHSKGLILLCVVLSFTLISCGNMKKLWLTATATKALDTDQFDKAIVKYNQLVKMDPQEHQNYWNLGIAYIQKKDYPNAQKQIRKLEELGKDDLARELKKMLGDYQKLSKKK